MVNQNNSNFNQALWLGIGQLCTFALSFVSAAILSRYFDKTEYGTFRQILYVYTTLSTLFTVGLPGVFAYFIPRLETGQQKTLINSMNRLFLLLGAAFSITLFFGADVIAKLLNNPELSVGIRIFSPFPLFTLPTMGVEGIYTALRKTKAIAIYHVVSKVLSLLCIVLPVVVWHTGYREAIIGWGCSSFIMFLVSMYMKNKPYFRVEKVLVQNMYKQVFDYCLPLVGAFIAGFFIHSADQFFISRYYGTESFAEASNGCLSIPIVAMVAGSIKSVLLPVFSKADSKGKLSNELSTYNNAVNKCVVLVFPILLFCAFFAKEIMVFIYGVQYEGSGAYLRVFILRDFVDCFPYLAVLLAIGRTRFYMNMHLIGALIIWALDLLISIVGLPPTSFVAVGSMFQIMIRVASFILIFRVTKINLINKEVTSNIFKVTIDCSISLLLLMLLANSLFKTLPLFLTLVICGILYYAIIIVTGRMVKIDYLEAIKMFLKR